jgi:hypothetical protein
MRTWLLATEARTPSVLPRLLPTTPCERGGIGRRAGFRSQWGNSRKGSSPFARTIPTVTPRQRVATGEPGHRVGAHPVAAAQTSADSQLHHPLIPGGTGSSSPSVIRPNSEVSV